MASNKLGPQDSEQLLFAIDVLKYILRTRYSHLLNDFIKTDLVMTVEGYRPGLEEHFVENIPKIVGEIEAVEFEAVCRDFLEIQSSSSLEDYINKVKDSILTKGFPAGHFLIFCVRVCVMACLFKIKGRQDALEVAIEKIETSFPNNKEGSLMWKEMGNLSKKYKKNSLGTVAPAFYRRESTDGNLSWTDDSSSSSSTTNTESDSASGSQNTTSSSAESLHELIMKLNASVKCTNNTEAKGNSTSVPSKEFPNIIDHKESAAASTTICTITYDNAENFTVTSFASADNSNAVESKESAPTSSTDDCNTCENKENISAPPSTNCPEIVVIECKEKSADQKKADESVQNPSVSSSTSKMPTCDLNFGNKFKIAFAASEDESLLSTKSPTKSLLGKRPSPRKEISLRGAVDDSEIDIKKPKLESPEKSDKEDEEA